VQLNRAGHPGGARQGRLAAAGTEVDQVAAVDDADEGQGASPVVVPVRVGSGETLGAVPRPGPRENLHVSLSENSSSPGRNPARKALSL